MLISLRYNFVFVAVPKCASTSLHQALSRYCDVILASPPPLKHLPFSEYETRLLPLLRDRLKSVTTPDPLALFRDPLDWLFSWYKYRSRPELAKAARERFAGGVSFGDFLDAHFREKPASFADIGGQSRFIKGADGRMDAVKLHRYEDLAGFVEVLQQRMAQPLPLKELRRSPPQRLDLDPALAAEARRKLKSEYEIYDAIA